MPQKTPQKHATKKVGKSLKELDAFPTFEENPDFYIDFGETGPYVVETGASECAT